MGQQTLILHFDGKGFSAPTVLQPGGSPAAVSRIWAYAPDDVWAFAPAGPLANPYFHFDGTAWTTVVPPVPPGARVLFPPTTAITPLINNSFAFDASHVLWVGSAGAFLRSQ